MKFQKIEFDNSMDLFLKVEKLESLNIDYTYSCENEETLLMSMIGQVLERKITKRYFLIIGMGSVD